MKPNHFLPLALLGLTLWYSCAFAINDTIDSTSPESSSPNTTNLMTITPAGAVPTSVPDSTININAQNKLNSDSTYDSSGLTVTTSSGTIKLQGHVKSQADLMRAVNALRSINGVVGVDISSVSVGTDTSTPSGDSSLSDPGSSY